MCVEQVEPVPHHCQSLGFLMVSSIPSTELPMGEPRRVAWAWLTTQNSGKAASIDCLVIGSSQIISDLLWFLFTPIYTVQVTIY